MFLVFKEHGVRKIKPAIVGSVLFFFSGFWSFVHAAQIELKSQGLDSALQEVGRIFDAQILYDPSLMYGKSTVSLSGNFELSGVLGRLLDGTGLTYKLGNGVIFISNNNSNSFEISPVDIRSNQATTEGTGSYTSNVVSLMKGAKSLKEIPQSVSIITRAQIEDRNMSTLQDVFEYAPGIYKQRMRTHATYSDSATTLYSRGFVIDTYMVDGVPSEGTHPSDGSAGSYQTSAISGSSAIYDRVEVLRGAAGLLIGQGAPGGTVNLVRKRPTYEFQQKYQVGAGSWDSYHSQADISGPLLESGALRGRLIFDYDNRGRHWDYTPTKSEDPMLYGIVDWDLSEKTRFTVGGRYEKYKEDSPARSTYQANWGYRDNKDEEVFLEVKHDINDDLQLSANARHKEFELNFLTPSIGLSTRSDWYAEIQSRLWKEKSDALDVNLLGAFEAFEREHKFTISFNGSERNSHNREGNLWSDFGDFNFDFDRFNYSPSSGWEDAISKLSDFKRNLRDEEPSINIVRQVGVFGKLDLELSDDVNLVVGSRATKYSYNSTYLGDKGAYSGKTDAFTPYAGLIYSLNEEWSAYVSYADIFRPQFNSWTRSGGLAKDVVGANYELGLKGALYDGKVNAAFALFQIDQENNAVSDVAPYDEVCPGNPSGGGCVVTIGKNRVRGFDAEISGEVTSGFQLAASYTYLHSEVLKGGSSGEFSGDLAGRSRWIGIVQPKHMFKVWGAYKFNYGLFEGLSVGGGGTMQSGQKFGTDLYEYNYPGYAIWDFFSRYDLSSNYSLALNVNNIFDKKYIRDIGTYSTVRYGTEDFNDSLIGAGRNYYVSFTAKF